VKSSAKSRVLNAYQEIVLTGVHLGSYGHDLGPAGRFTAIAFGNPGRYRRAAVCACRRWNLGYHTGISSRCGRIRDCADICTCPCKVAVMKRCAHDRRTSQAEFREVVEVARQHIPGVAIATDVIVGFPGETDAEFAISKAFVEAMDFADMHVFAIANGLGRLLSDCRITWRMT